MCTLLFIDIGTTGADPGKNRILQLSTRLVLPAGPQDYNQRVQPENFTVPVSSSRVRGTTNRVADAHETSIAQLLAALSRQIERTDIIIGHNVESDIAVIIAEAKRNGNQDMVATLTHPKFGLDGGRRAAICTQCLADDYFRFLGESPSLPDAKLSTVYQRLFREELLGAHDASVGVVACQRVYNHIRSFQLEHGLEFQSDIVCLDAYT